VPPERSQFRKENVSQRSS